LTALVRPGLLIVEVSRSH